MNYRSIFLISGLIRGTARRSLSLHAFAALGTRAPTSGPARATRAAPGTPPATLRAMRSPAATAASRTRWAAAAGTTGRTNHYEGYRTGSHPHNNPS